MVETVVIAGGGHAAGQAAVTLRQNGFEGQIVLAGEEAWLPYQRPPLSKKFLAGELSAERLFVKPPSFYDTHGISVRLNTRVDEIDRNTHAVRTHDGDSIGYDKLILALGSRVRTIQVPGSELPGIHYLRSIADVEGIRAGIEPGKRAVIIGAGYIGLEVAAVCRQLGLEVSVVEMAERVMSRVVSSQVSDFYQQLHEDHGVNLLLSTALQSFEGNARVTGVVTADGKCIEADIVVVGVGVLPNTDIAEIAGLAVDDGILVDECCRTGDTDIYAIGDCTRHPNGVYQRMVRLESVHNALEQAKTAASNICGSDTRYEQVPWFWSDQYDIKLQIAGLSEGYDEVIVRGDPGERHFACCYLKDGRLIAVDAVNSPREFMQSKSLIALGPVIDTKRLADASVQLRELA